LFSVLSFACSSLNATVLIMLQAVVFFSMVYVLSIYEPARMRVSKSKAGNIIMEGTARKFSFITIFYKREKTTVSTEEK